MSVSLFYKEWIKLRVWWACLILGSSAFALFLFFQMRYVAGQNDAEMVWNAWLYKGYLFYSAFKYVPLLIGGCLGIAQFLPEVQGRRLRLILHLPMGEERAVLIHLLAGLLLLVLALLPAFVIFVLGGGIYFPMEWLKNLFWVMSPWALSGFGAYLTTAALLLEVRWKYRIVYLLVCGGMLRLFLMDGFYDAYAYLLPWMLLWTIGLILLPLLASYRFRKGMPQ